jgi:hypothetical protein
MKTKTVTYRKLQQVGNRFDANIKSAHSFHYQSFKIRQKTFK